MASGYINVIRAERENCWIFEIFKIISLSLSLPNACVSDSFATIYSQREIISSICTISPQVRDKFWIEISSNQMEENRRARHRAYL